MSMEIGGKPLVMHIGTSLHGEIRTPSLIINKDLPSSSVAALPSNSINNRAAFISTWHMIWLLFEHLLSIKPNEL
jgi:hypothetical protein